ncbi:hypothetical protein BJG92_02822 [Arthrobacter sp. SO5]|uniref:hypothetical protein n=1 Tax=Arthrobacter sp. SO5 TaxID=1897055 RepID=UPI001E572358|nr:hypothetical protein [Arthrobacter sp. SO5]MCB5275274.1 hypothetical protein [Arthrobacter sp. SO5]
MSKPQPVLARLVALAAAVGVVAGCSSPGPASNPSTSAIPSPSAGSSQPEDVAQLCAASNDFASALTNFKDTLKPGATIEQVRSARDEAVKAYDALIKESEKLAQERAAAVVAAEKEFVSAVNAVSSQATVPQAVDSLRSEAAKVQASVADLRRDVKC